MRTIALLLALAYSLAGQVIERYAATTGDLSLMGAGTTATIQQPATGATQVVIEQIVVYCSVACSVTQAANGSAATTTTGTLTPLLPTPAQQVPPPKFFTASNVGSGTAQGGAVHVPAGGTVVMCLAKSCGNGGDVALSAGAGTGANYSVSIGSITGTANITFYVRSSS